MDSLKKRVEKYVWYGTKKKNILYNYSFYYLFYSLLYIINASIKINDLFYDTIGFLFYDDDDNDNYNEIRKQSYQLRSLNYLLQKTKFMQVPNIKDIRVPFLGIINKYNSFDYHLFDIDNDLTGFILNYKYTSTSIIIYVHGGGFISGDFGGFRCFVNQIAQRSDHMLLFPNYRLAPENHITDQVDDVIKTINYAMKTFNIQMKDIILIGDSAGGNLCLLTLQKLKEQPKKCILLSPVTDLTCNTQSFNNNEGTCMYDKKVVKYCMDVAKTKYDADNPLISSLFGSFKNLCPLYFMVSKNEIFYDDTLFAVQKAMGYNVPVTLVEKSFVPHSYPLFYFICPEAEEGLNQIIKWIKQD